MFFQANCIVFQKEIHHTCLCGYRAGIKMMGWGVPGPKEKMLRLRGSSLRLVLFKTKKIFGMKIQQMPWRNLSPGFDSQGVLNPWEIQPDPWELSPRLHRVESQFTFVQWCKGFSSSGEVKPHFVSLGDSGMYSADFQPHQIYALLNASRWLSIF